ncbi:MAG: proline racemase family protein [Fimbriimonadaceae bacterium]|nr:proline racemase family protein [Fimbriimonadaceae bacterium]QYK56768.1 MAG: proline racemase family protein [Fimbriimonadaceae bacterium]
MRIDVVDSHTGGEPTRMVFGDHLGLAGDAIQIRNELSRSHDWLRRTLCLEPRGSDVAVGAVVTPTESAEPGYDVVFFNNVGYLGMCGHGLIGVVESLRFLGQIAPGRHTFHTPAGRVTVDLLDDSRVEVKNVPSYCYQQSVVVDTSHDRPVLGDLAYGGNWFFLTDHTDHHLGSINVHDLHEFSLGVRAALSRAGLTGPEGEVIDHIALFGAPSDSTLSAQNFVLCPGGAFDRSPCGTGTSAKLACLAARGDLLPGEVWRQEGISGSVFEAWYEPAGENQVTPYIRGRAFVTAETRINLDPEDPFRHGFRLNSSLGLVDPGMRPGIPL